VAEGCRKTLPPTRPVGAERAIQAVAWTSDAEVATAMMERGALCAETLVHAYDQPMRPGDLAGLV
jgi:hypothetical protein